MLDIYVRLKMPDGRVEGDVPAHVVVWRRDTGFIMPSRSEITKCIDIMRRIEIMRCIREEVRDWLKLYEAVKNGDYSVMMRRPLPPISYRLFKADPLSQDEQSSRIVFQKKIVEAVDMYRRAAEEADLFDKPRILKSGFDALKLIGMMYYIVESRLDPLDWQFIYLYPEQRKETFVELVLHYLEKTGYIREYLDDVSVIDKVVALFDESDVDTIARSHENAYPIFLGFAQGVRALPQSA